MVISRLCSMLGKYRWRCVVGIGCSWTFVWGKYFYLVNICKYFANMRMFDQICGPVISVKYNFLNCKEISSVLDQSYLWERGNYSESIFYPSSACVNKLIMSRCVLCKYLVSSNDCGGSHYTLVHKYDNINYDQGLWLFLSVIMYDCM